MGCGCRVVGGRAGVWGRRCKVECGVGYGMWDWVFGVDFKKVCIFLIQKMHFYLILFFSNRVTGFQASEYKQAIITFLGSFKWPYIDFTLVPIHLICFIDSDSSKFVQFPIHQNWLYT